MSRILAFWASVALFYARTTYALPTSLWIRSDPESATGGFALDPISAALFSTHLILLLVTFYLTYICARVVLASRSSPIAIRIPFLSLLASLVLSAFTRILSPIDLALSRNLKNNSGHSVLISGSVGLPSGVLIAQWFFAIFSATLLLSTILLVLSHLKAQHATRLGAPESKAKKIFNWTILGVMLAAGVGYGAISAWAFTRVQQILATEVVENENGIPGLRPHGVTIAEMLWWMLIALVILGGAFYIAGLIVTSSLMHTARMLKVGLGRTGGLDDDNVKLMANAVCPLILTQTVVTLLIGGFGGFALAPARSQGRAVIELVGAVVFGIVECVVAYLLVRVGQRLSTTEVRA